MKDLKLFILINCPYCQQALKYIEELQQEEKYRDIKYQLIDERKEKALADSYDYYYVPTFYLDEQKVHEGIVSKEQVQAIFDQALNH